MVQPEPPQALLVLVEGLGSALPFPRAGFVARHVLAAAKMALKALVGPGVDEIILVWARLQEVTWRGHLFLLTLPH